MQRILLVGALLLAAAACAQPAADAPAENLALGKPYTVEPAPNYELCASEGDTTTDLTDGQYVEGYFWTQPGTVGWSNRNPVIVTVDLGETQPIGGAAYNTAAGRAGVGWPTAVFVFVSDDGQTWFRAGELVSLSAAHGTPPTDYAVHRFWTDELATRGRYVSFVVASGGPYTFVDEVEVYRGDAALLNQPREAEPVTQVSDAFWTHLVTASVRSDVARTVSQIRDAVNAAGLADAEKQRLSAQLDAALAANDPGELGADFVTTWPLTDAHAAALAAQAALWRAQGRPAWNVWPAHRYDPVSPLDAPPAEAAAPSLDIALMRGEQRGAAVNVANAADEARPLQVSFRGLPGGAAPDWAEVRYAPFTAVKGAPVNAIALPEAERGADGWSVDMPAGLLRQIWLTVDATELAAGEYSGAMVLASGGETVAEIPVKLDVSALQMPAQLALGLGGWDYTDSNHRGITEENRDGTIAFLREYGVNLPWATSGVMPFGTHDETGAMTAPPSTERMDTWLDRWPNARRYYVFNAFGRDVPDTEAGRRRVAEWISFWVDHLEQRGIEPSQLGLLLVDEPHSAEQDARIIGYAKVIRETEPEVIIFNDPTWRDPREADPQMLALSGVLCPNRPMWRANNAAFEEVFLAQRDAGRDLALYSCSGPGRGLDPYSYFRLQAWDAFRYGADETFFWAFGDNGGASSWNEYAAPGVNYSPQFLSPEGNTTSKSMEAIREGLYDYEYLALLRDALTQAEAAGSNDAAVARARELLNQGVADVVARDEAAVIDWWQDKDRTVADRVRREVLDTLEALS